MRGYTRSSHNCNLSGRHAAAAARLEGPLRGIGFWHQADRYVHTSIHKIKEYFLIPFGCPMCVIWAMFQLLE